MFFEVLRYTVFGIFAVASAAAIGSWAVRTRRISPFSKSANFIRRSTDPILKPIESQLLRRGGNPQNAEWWLLGGTVVGGIVIISATGWIANQFLFVTRAGPRGMIFLAGQIVTWAIIIRVVGTWMGVGRHNKFMRPMYFLTDWIVEPLRRIIPPFGMIDISPIAAYFLIQIIVGLLV
ncbi:MAG: YggT family protein [Gemmatimonadetes bacterium]|nr:YggT family protein [Gemmatimonadota bacterium]MCH7491252.1 YggT family protein [Gemmatimonadota bacterium]MCH7716312.1 YggT family protein [Gemmatimonadota bacterium]